MRMQIAIVILTAALLVSAPAMSAGDNKILQFNKRLLEDPSSLTKLRLGEQLENLPGLQVGQGTDFSGANLADQVNSQLNSISSFPSGTGYDWSFDDRIIFDETIMKEQILVGLQTLISGEIEPMKSTATDLSIKDDFMDDISWNLKYLSFEETDNTQWYMPPVIRDTKLTK